MPGPPHPTIQTRSLATSGHSTQSRRPAPRIQTPRQQGPLPAPEPLPRPPVRAHTMPATPSLPCERSPKAPALVPTCLGVLSTPAVPCRLTASKITPPGQIPAVRPGLAMQLPAPCLHSCAFSRPWGAGPPCSEALTRSYSDSHLGSFHSWVIYKESRSGELETLT
ncbi:hypothetical protein VULLAG_LOCUS17361 [Vulpes lagopus]